MRLAALCLLALASFFCPSVSAAERRAPRLPQCMLPAVQPATCDCTITGNCTCGNDCKCPSCRVGVTGPMDLPADDSRQRVPAVQPVYYRPTYQPAFAPPFSGGGGSRRGGGGC